MLERFGLSAFDEAVYRALLARSCGSVTDLAAALAADEMTVRASVGVLADAGFATAAGPDETYAAVPPDLALRLAVSRQEIAVRDALVELGRLRASSVTIVRALGVGARDPEGTDEVSIVRGPAAVTAALHDVADLARSRLVHMQPAPVDPADVPKANRGVECRGLYERAVVDDAALLNALLVRQLRDEHVRLLPRPPLRGLVADDRAAVIVSDADPLNIRAVVVHSSTLLTGVVALFDLLWERAIPVDFRRDRDTEWRISEDDAELLRLLAAGLKDQAIARYLGVGLRTVTRRIGEVSRALDAESRFQAGLQAARRGLL